MQQPKHILVIRFSAMGDVAMTVPVIKNVLQQNPSLQITVVSNAFFKPLFDGLERCNFHPAYLKAQHKGIPGLYCLYKELKTGHTFDAVADLHNVLRSKIIRFFFKGTKTSALNKGRDEKKALTRKENKVLHQLTPMHERYAEVFRQIELPVTLTHAEPVYKKQALPEQLQAIFNTGKQIIGVAPFAQHQEKMYPIEKMKNVVKELAASNKSILLFGGGKEESEILNQWEKEIQSAKNMADKFSFTEELAAISNLDLMISMDSANMHLASLYDVPVISIWGATHHYTGFYGWGQNEKNIVEITDLNCRPCSVFGNKPCFRGDHACMNWIEEKMIVEKVVNRQWPMANGQ